MSSIIRLNVGGTLFVSRKDTLIGGSSFFTAMFNEQMNPGELHDDAIFIDRDSDTFKQVLSYLRKLDSWEAPEDPALLLNLLSEAEFFGLDGMIDKIKERVPPVLPMFEIYLKFNKNAISGTAYTSSTPKAIKTLLDRGLNTPRDGHATIVLQPSKVEYTNLIDNILLLIGPHYKITQVQQPSILILVCNDRYDTALYDALRKKLYPQS